MAALTKHTWPSTMCTSNHEKMTKCFGRICLLNFMIITSILNLYIFYVFGAKIWKNTVCCCVVSPLFQWTGSIGELEPEELESEEYLKNEKENLKSLKHSRICLLGNMEVIKQIINKRIRALFGRSQRTYHLSHSDKISFLQGQVTFISPEWTSKLYSIGFDAIFSL